MIFIDTNYLLRFLRDDIPEQSKVVKALFLSASGGEKKLFTSTVVFFEIFWVMKSVYGQEKERIVDLLRKVLSLNFIDIADREILWNSLELFGKTSLELEDCYNIAFAKEHRMMSFATFDKNVQKTLKRLEKWPAVR